jgi:hypothetical protein
MVRARANRADYLFGLGGSKDELDVLWWLFNNLQQRVEALGRNHVGLVKNEDLVAVTHRRKHGTFAKVTGIIHTVVAGGVDLNDIKRTRPIASQLNAAGALATGGIGWTLGAVEAASQNAGGCRFATTARPTE